MGNVKFGVVWCVLLFRKKKKRVFFFPFLPPPTLPPLLSISFSLSLSPYLPGPDPKVVRRAPVQARVEDLPAGRHGDVVGDDLEAHGRLRAGAGPDVAVAEPRGELDQGRVLEGRLAGGVAEDLVLDGGCARAACACGEGGGGAVFVFVFVFFGGRGKERGEAKF